MQDVLPPIPPPVRLPDRDRLASTVEALLADLLLVRDLAFREGFVATARGTEALLVTTLLEFDRKRMPVPA